MTRLSIELNKMWETDGYWIGNDYTVCDVAYCFINNEDMRLLVDRKVPFDTFQEWYDYDLKVEYGKSLGKNADRINLLAWINGLPEKYKIPKETLDAWEAEHWRKKFDEQANNNDNESKNQKTQ